MTEHALSTDKDGSVTASNASALRDFEVQLPDTPHALADLARAIGDTGVSLEGGGMFAPGNVHYLVSIPTTSATAALIDAAERAGALSLQMNPVVLARLDQETPGQLGLLLTRLSCAGVRVRTQYSDHAGALVLVVDSGDVRNANSVVADWE